MQEGVKHRIRVRIGKKAEKIDGIDRSLDFMRIPL